ncbi:MAG TPA: CHC2 zinc finger domain-containing protein [Terriglobales bacterium]|nr:CHC2 zinc finger domain-containing protein [Terriglobales bacterium]
MARIPESEIERLKREVSVQRLAEARGVELKRHGADLVGLCPFHNDKEPSLVISPRKNLWHCLGACAAGGTAIDWVMRSEGVSFRHAVEMLRNDAPLTGARGKRSLLQRLPDAIEREAEDRELLLQVVGYYNDALKQAPEALQYLERRGLRSSEMLDHFRLGFANRTLGYRLPPRYSAAGLAVRERLQKLGVLRESGHEHFTGSVVIPIFDLEGQVRQMYGRKVTRITALRDGTPAHLYLPGPHQAVWNEQALIASKEIILCEALIDALTFWCAGFRHVTTSYGVNGFTEQHKAAFQKHGTKKIYIAYDRDEAGENAARQHAEELLAMGIDCYRVLFPKNMDANEYALKVQPAPKSLGVLLNRAEWLGKGKRPTTTVIELTPATKHEPPIVLASKMEPATKEKNAEPTATTIAEKISEPVLSLAAESEAAESMPENAPRPSTLLPSIEVPTEIKGDEITITQGDRRYRVRGLGKNLSYELLKVNVLAARRQHEGLHVDTLDLYSARQRGLFIKQAAEEMGVEEETIRRDLGRVLLKLEELQEEQIRKTLEPEEDEVTLSEEEQTAALALLRDPKLLDRILADLERCGVVGEETNKLVGYLAAVSRLLEAPLAVMVQSASAAGKSSLMEAVLALVPTEQLVEYSAMTGQALFYMGEGDLKHKVLAIVEEEGAQRAAYALKLLQSEGVLTIGSTGKDPSTGRLVTHQYRVEGPVMIFLTTTAIDVDEELLNRCLVLTVNEDRQQTQAIHKKQREGQTIEGLLRREERAAILKLHRNAQRLLKPVYVVNPHALKLTFPDTQTRTRRDHMKYLTLIRAITLLHQYQRPIESMAHQGKTVEYIESSKEDNELAKRLMNEVLVRSLDELPPQTRRLLLLIDELVTRACEQQKMERSEYRFSRRDVRQFTGLGNTQLKMHLHRLEEHEYLIVHRGGRGQSFVYELYFERDQESGQPVLPGIMGDNDAKKSGPEGEKSGSGRPQVGPVSGGGRDGFTPAMARPDDDFRFHLEKITAPATRENGAVLSAVAGAK